MSRHHFSFTHASHMLARLSNGWKLFPIPVIAGLVLVLMITLVAFTNDPPWPAAHIQFALSLI